jgi:hypothetical protein
MVLVFGGIVNGVNHVLGFAAVVTAAFAGTARYTAVLIDADKRQVERTTAFGFYLGVLLSVLLLILDRIQGG